MNILVIGRGGREHSLVKKIEESPRVDTVYAAPGNAGMTEAELVSISETDVEELIHFAKTNQVAWTVVGPEVALMNGIVNQFREAGLDIFGPTKEAARIEGSKAFAKDIMKKYDIPTAKYESFTSSNDAKAYVKDQGAPIVIKADGLAAGKGVTVAMSVEEAIEAIDVMMEQSQFGDAGKEVVIEEYLEGEEFSLMAFVHGYKVYPLIPSQDHKRIFDGDTGPNTGGMGAYAPVPHLSQEAIEAAVRGILEPTAAALVEEKRSFSGILYAGCIQTQEGPKVIEFNARFGDPETQVVLPLLENDFIQVMEDVQAGIDPQLNWKDGFCAGVVVSSAGYPGDYQKGILLPNVKGNRTVIPIYAGVRNEDNQLVSDGGRVFLLSAQGDTLEETIETIYNTLQEAQVPSTFFYRRDIARKAIRTSVSGYKYTK
ncbi:phosphoribosylamine--glycine ligase [Pontibacillus sp. HMF3514]|uniref:phosphoribosylamine--glycine ligase n=1 Tax=Pontibacillus sp. HMF3514 TaxID=2692425 RepID=UPI00131FC0EE|nr:phosphoribosylamine--glycine ligase [Pontibacillus sp. HMF3514]QHE50971.1 phosphoribosylamine--glycine ligase [Pontibacillus sp. HMF3514]